MNDFHVIILIVSALAYVVGKHSVKLGSLDRRVSSLEIDLCQQQEEEDDEDPEEEDSKRLDAHRRRDKPHFDAD